MSWRARIAAGLLALGLGALAGGGSFPAPAPQAPRAQRPIEAPAPLPPAPRPSGLEARLLEGTGKEPISIYHPEELASFKARGVSLDYAASVTGALVRANPKYADPLSSYSTSRLVADLHAKFSAATVTRLLERPGFRGKAFDPDVLARMEAPEEFVTGYLDAIDAAFPDKAFVYSYQIDQLYGSRRTIEDLKAFLSVRSDDGKPVFTPNEIYMLRAPPRRVLETARIPTQEGTLAQRAHEEQGGSATLVSLVNNAYERLIPARVLAAWAQDYDLGSRHIEILGRLAVLASDEGPGILRCVGALEGKQSLTWNTIENPEAYVYCANGLLPAEVTQFIDTPLPDAALVLSYSDHNGASEGLGMKDLVGRMRQHYDLATAMMVSPEDIPRLAELVPDAELVAVSGHGAPESLVLYKRKLRGDPEGEKVTRVYDTQTGAVAYEMVERDGLEADDPELGSYFAGFRRKPTLFLFSCLTAGKAEQGENLASSLARQTGYRVIAASESFNAGDVHVLEWHPFSARITRPGKRGQEMDVTYDSAKRP